MLCGQLIILKKSLNSLWTSCYIRDA